MDQPIMYDSDLVAVACNVDLGRSAKGNLFVEESSARYDGCTHRPCGQCGKPAEKIYTKCEDCRRMADIERYSAMPFESWGFDGIDITPIYSKTFDKYYFNEDDIRSDIEEYMEDNQDEKPNMMLVICVPNNYHNINPDYWQGVLPEDGDIPTGLIKKIEEFNEFLSTLEPASWSPGKIRTDYEYE